MLASGFGEEAGWRGFLLPRWGRRLSPRAAALAVALAWGLWHLPLVVDPAAIGKGGAAGASRWAVGIVAGSFILAWVRHRSGSALACALFHGFLGVASTASADPYAGHLATRLLGAGAVALAAFAAPFSSRAPRAAPPPAPDAGAAGRG